MRGSGVMNKTKIEWCDYTWNPITGCLNGCEYCYARKIYQRFKKDFTPQIHYSRLPQPLKCKTPSKIFVCSVSDFWGRGVEPIWREEVYNVIKATPEHTYLILTKQPQNIEDWDRIPENVWLGVTITGDADEWRTKHLEGYEGIKFISCEPLLFSIISIPKYIDWVIIGALTGRNGWLPENQWVEDIIKMTKPRPLFLKDNLMWGDKIQEFPASPHSKGVTERMRKNVSNIRSLEVGKR